MIVRFDQPELLWLALGCVPMMVLGWRWLSVMDRLRRTTVLGLRAVLLLSVVVMLAGPRSVREHDNLTVIGVLDLSGSVKRFARLPEIPELQRRSSVEYLRRWFREATATRTRDDRFGLVVFDGKATVVSAPVTGDYVDDNLDVQITDGTNIADAIRMALALFPSDAGKRIVLVTANTQSAVQNRARDRGVQFVAKPLTPDNIRSVLENLGVSCST